MFFSSFNFIATLIFKNLYVHSLFLKHFNVRKKKTFDQIDQIIYITFIVAPIKSVIKYDIFT